MDQQVLHGHKGGAGKQHTPVEEKNTLLSKSYAKVLLAIGEGEFAGNPTAEDIYLDGTPLQSAGGLQNFGGVKWEYRSGRSDQSYITGVPDVSNEFAINLALTSDTPWTRLITTPSLDAVRITLAWPAVYEQKDNGDIVGYNIEYAIDVSTNGGAYVEQGKWSTNKQKTTVEYNRTHRIDLPKPGTSWTLRVRRLTPNKNNGKFGDTMSIKSIAEVIDAKLRYPNTALLFVEFDAETFGGSSIPKISVKTKGRLIQVPSNYDPETRTYSGVWNGTFKWAYTNNPAWVFYDLVTNERFGLGSRITADMVDKWTLYQVSQYCDVMVPDGNGGTEPRYTCNIYIQSRKEAWQVLRDVVAIFNGMLHWSGTQIVASADMPVATNTVRTYSRSNVVDGKFTYGSTSEKTITTTALVSYDDPDNHYETAVEAVNDLNLVQRYKTWNQSEIAAIGVTSRGQAQRKGKYQMLTNSINRMVTFKLGLEGYLPRPGEVFGVADQLLAGSTFAGRVSSATIKTVTCDRAPNAAPGDILYVNKADGTLGEGRTIQSVVGNVITVTANYSAIPEAELGWYVEKTTLKSQLYRTTKVTWADNEGTFEVTGVQYEDSKYAAVDHGARLESRPITSIPAGSQDAPTGLTVSSFSYIEQTLAVTTLSVKWSAAVGAMNYEAQWRKDGGDWINVGITASTGFEVRGIYSGAYQARVRAINAIGTKSLWAESTNTQLNGKSGAPPTLTAFATVSEIFGIRINWAFQDGAEDGAYIQLQQATDINGANATELAMVPYPTQTYLKSNMLGGVSAYFRGRLIDRSGNESAWTSWLYGVSEYGTDKILESIVGEIGRTELGQELLSEIDTTKADVSAAKEAVVDVTNSLVALNAEVDANKLELQNQLDNTWTLLSQQITSVNQSVSELNQDVAALETQATALRTDLDAAVKAAEYDATKTYAVGDIARKGQRLYQALVAVPVNKTPPNATYWKDVGTILQEAGATAAQVVTNTTAITNQGNTLTSHTSQLTGLTTRITDAETNITGNSDALSNLSSTVTQQGNAITSQGQSLTTVQATVNGIAGAGTNLLEDSYSWLTSTTLPTLGTSLVTATAVAVAESPSGFGYSVSTTNNSIYSYFTLAKANNTASYNLSLEPGTYLVSMYIKGSAAGQAMANLYDSVTSRTATINYSTTRTRYVFPIEVTSSIKCGLLVYPNRQGDASVTLVVDSVMVEKRIGANNTASPFVSGASATSAANAASATTALTARVTTAEGTITSQGNSLTSLTNRVTNAEGTLSSQGTAISGLTSTVTSQGGTIASQGNAITNLSNTVDGKADSSAVSTLTSRVTAAEGNIASQGQSITSLNDSLQYIGGENLLYNPSFDTVDPAKSWLGDGWQVGVIGAGTNVTPSLIASTLDPSGKAQRLDVTGLTTGSPETYAEMLPTTERRTTASAGQVTTLSAYVRGTAGMIVQLYIQAVDSSGTAIGTTTGPYVTLTSSWQRIGLLGTAFPANTVKATIRIRHRAATGLLSGFLEVDRVQLEVGKTMSGWSDNGQVIAAAATANAAATSALTNRVTNAEDTITSQGSSITSLTNRVTTAEGNITSQGSAIGSLTSTVTTQGNTITSQGNSLTALTASLSQAPDNLVLKGTFEDGDIGPWTNGPLIANVTAHPAYSKAIQFYANSFCGTARNIITAPGEQFDCSADIWNNYMTSGQTTRLQIQFYDKNVVSLGYYTAFTCYAGVNGFQTYSGRITAPAGSVSARLVIRHETTTETGRSLWCNIICRRVTAADTANADALSSLTTTVTNQGNTLTSQGSAITGLQSSIANSGGAGANLLPDTYSWLTSTTLPPTYPNAVTAAGVSVAASASGYGYKCTSTSTNTSAYLALTTIVGAAGYTIPVEAGNYLVSFYASTPTSASIMANLYDGTSRLSISQPITTTRTRYALMVTVAAAAKIAVILYPNRLGVTSTEVIIDSVMLEKMNSGATVTTPSPFVPGPSAAALSAQSAALSTLTTRVTATEGDIASQSNSITSLNNSLNNIGGDNMLPNSSFEELSSATNASWWVVAATVAGLVSSIVDSTLPQSTKAQRIAHSAIPVNGYAEIRGNNLAADRIKVKGGSPYVLTTWARGTPTTGMAMRQYIGFYDAAGANVGTPTSVGQMTDQFTRYTLAVTAPATAVTALVYAARIINGTSATSAIWMEVDNVQLQEGTVATAYQPSTEKAVSTLSSAVDSLDTRVTSAEGTITSQGNSITSLNNTVANKADSSALAALTSRVTTAEGNITSQGSSVTTLQNQVNAIGGSGTNLLSDEYSWLTSTTLPTINGSATTTVGVAVAGSASGYGYKMTSTSTATSAYLMLSPTNSAAGWNIPVEVGTYLVSFYASAPATATVRVRLYSATGSAYSTTTVPMTTTRTRYTLQVPFGGISTVAVLFYYNMSGVSGTEVTVDSVMVEKQVGPTATASPFVAGPSARTVTAQGTALTALTNRVTTAEGTLSSASSAITDLQNTIGTAGSFDPAPGCTWNFDGSSTDGWTVANATMTSGTGVVTIAATTADPQFQGPAASMNIAGSTYNRIRAKITRRAGATTDWDGIVYYSTSAHGWTSGYFAKIANPNLAIGQSAIVEWDMSALTAGGTDWTSNTIQRIRLDFGNTVGGSFEVDWVSVGRVAPSASAGALSSLESTVTQQGSDISAQASSISSLNTTVGSHTTSISTISSTQNTTNGKLNALYSVKLGINSGGKYYAAGMGIGIENTPSGMQSQVLFVADRFAILNSVNGTATSPFVVQNGQTFIADAFINKATVTNAIIGSGIYSAAQTNWGGPVMTQDFNAGNVVTRHPTRANTYTVLNQDGLQVVVDGVLRVRMGIW